MEELLRRPPGEGSPLDGGLRARVRRHSRPFPQIRAIGGAGPAEIDWLERYALPEECKAGRPGLARAVGPGEFTDGLVHGPTRALVSARIRPGMDGCHRGRVGGPATFTSGLGAIRRKTAPGPAHSPEAALADSADLICAGKMRTTALTRSREFSLSTSDEMLALARTARQGVLVHLAHQENWRSREPWPGCSRGRGTTGTPTARARLGHLAKRVRAQRHPGDAESTLRPSTALRSRTDDQQQRLWGQRRFPAWPARGKVRDQVVALGSDVGAGTGLFSCPRSGPLPA